ncbi:MAG: response regulator [Bdellovibrionota bacterium]
MKNTKKVLVIEDEESVQRFLITTLEANSYLTRAELNGQKGIQGAIEFRPDLVLLDLGLPDMDGHQVLAKIREWSKVPVIVLTARDADEDKVKSLDNGADDYLTKPFSVPELLVRIRVALRHSESVGHEAVIQIGKLAVDLSGHIVKVDGQEVKLSATEYDILKVLVKNAGKIVTHRMLLKEVWGPNSIEHTQYLRVYVGQLRKKLQRNDNIPELISTETGIGYRLISE